MINTVMRAIPFLCFIFTPSRLKDSVVKERCGAAQLSILSILNIYNVASQ
jgi:hypothetical protein